MKLQMYKKSWKSGSSPYFKVSVDLRWPISSQRSAARSIAYHNWGQVNQMKTEIRGADFTVFYFSCSGHGGYIVFCERKLPEWFSETEYSCEFYDWNFPKTWYFYLFEEDCDWANLVVALPQDMREELSYLDDFDSFEGHALDTV